MVDSGIALGADGRGYFSVSWVVSKCGYTKCALWENRLGRRRRRMTSRESWVESERF